MTLDEQYWNNRYLNHQTGWDLGQVSPALKAYFDQLEDKNIKILIPGCGNAYEAQYLLDSGFTKVTLVDISENLVENLQKQLATYIDLGYCQVLHQDFFQHEGKYDLIIEQTFFCALEPSFRPVYTQKMYQLLDNKGKLIGLLFNVMFEGGPPFGGFKEEYEGYFKSYFNIKTLEACYNSIKPREGNELFMILEKK